MNPDTPKSPPVHLNTEYTCACCGRSFTAVRSHEEAVEECREHFGLSPENTECDVWCDECYQRHFGVYSHN